MQAANAVRVPAIAGTGKEPDRQRMGAVGAPVRLRGRSDTETDGRTRRAWSRPLWIIALCPRVVLLRFLATNVTRRMSIGQAAIRPPPSA